MDLHLEKNGFANLFPQSSDLSTPKGFHITDDDKETHAIVRNYVSRPNGVIDDDNDDDPFQVEILARTSQWILKQSAFPKPMGLHHSSLQKRTETPKLGIGTTPDPFEDSFDLGNKGPDASKLGADSSGNIGLAVLREMLAGYGAPYPGSGIHVAQQRQYFPPIPSQILNTSHEGMPASDPLGRYLPRRLFPLKKTVAESEPPAPKTDVKEADLYKTFNNLDLGLEQSLEQSLEVEETDLTSQMSPNSSLDEDIVVSPFANGPRPRCRGSLPPPPPPAPVNPSHQTQDTQLLASSMESAVKVNQMCAGSEFEDGSTRTTPATSADGCKAVVKNTEEELSPRSGCFSWLKRRNRRHRIQPFE